MQPEVKLQAEDPAHWVVRYDSLEALLEDYDQALVHGALFVKTEAAPPPGSSARVDLDLAFCGARLWMEAMVVAARPTGAEQVPGVSLQLAGAPDALRQQLQGATGVTLPDPEVTPVGCVRRAPRFDARATVEIVFEGERYFGETGNMSTNGVLVLVRTRALGPGNRLELRIHAPRASEPFVLQGRVSNNTRCYGGVMALGVQFLYELSRYEEVSSFVDDLRSFHHARALATVSGSLDQTSLAEVLENFANAATAGTLSLRRGEQTGKIGFCDGKVVHASAGLASGQHAIARLLTWETAQFELRPELEVGEETEPPVPVTAALLSAAVERDELVQHGVAQLDPATRFALDATRLRALARSLTDFAHEIIENAALGFPLGAMIDFVDAGDTRFYETLTELIDGGVLRIVAPEELPLAALA